MNILFIGSLNTKKHKYDGERIKTTLIYECLLKKHKITVVNLSKHKYLQCIRILWHGLFSSTFDKIIISKDPRGARIIHIILNFCKTDFSKIIYLEIGPLLEEVFKKHPKSINLFKKDKRIVVETNDLASDLEKYGLNNCVIFQNFKKRYNNELVLKDYPVEVLDCIFLSRMEFNKGIFDIIKSLNIINKNRTLVHVDFYGEFCNQNEKKRFLSIIEGRNDCCFNGSIEIKDKTSYEKLSNYDLHIFPTRYDEGIPGSIIDFLFAGVPTLSSSFKHCFDILDKDCSYVFEQNNIESMIKSLDYIYSNQLELNNKRKLSFIRGSQFTDEQFGLFLDSLL